MLLLLLLLLTSERQPLAEGAGGSGIKVARAGRRPLRGGACRALGKVEKEWEPERESAEEERRGKEEEEE